MMTFASIGKVLKCDNIITITEIVSLLYGEYYYTVSTVACVYTQLSTFFTVLRIPVSHNIFLLRLLYYLRKLLSLCGDQWKAIRCL